MRATSAFALLLALPTPSASLAVGAGAVSAPRAPVHAPIRAAATFAPGILASGRSRVRSARMEAFSFDPFGGGLQLLWLANQSALALSGRFARFPERTFTQNLSGLTD